MYKHVDVYDFELWHSASCIDSVISDSELFLTPTVPVEVNVSLWLLVNKFHSTAKGQSAIQGVVYIHDVSCKRWVSTSTSGGNCVTDLDTCSVEMGAKKSQE